jgi:DNA-binding CsgD family transcriptional regulator
VQLLGRRAECDFLDAALADALDGRSRVVVLRGEAGIGKSALLEHLTDRLEGWRVARAVGVEAELELAYSGLHQICSPMLDELERLPGPQREALASVFGLSTGAAPNRFLVGLATLTLFAEIAEERPLACLVDDAHWLDHASEQILAFVARRLLAERVVIVCTARTDVDDNRAFAGLPELPIGGLDDSDARSLLLSNMPGPIDAAVCQQIITESHGNPLALIELTRVANVGEFAGGFGTPASDGVTGTIERAYVQRIDALPAQARLLLVLAAAEPLGDRSLLDRAAEILGIELDELAPAVDAGLVSVGARVEFAHPLARSAAYRSAGFEDRSRIHAALAEATDPRSDPDRRAWHHARATPGPDEAIARELVESAARARRRGGVGAAAAFFKRAVELTQDPSLRAERAVTAAQLSFQAGAFDRALDAVAIAEAGELDEFGQAQADLVRAHVRLVRGYGDDAAPLLMRAAKRLEPFDAELAQGAYLAAYGSATAAAHLGQDGNLLELCHAIEELPFPEGAGDPARLLLEGLARMHTDDSTVAMPILKRAATAVAELPADDVLRWGWLAPMASQAAWDSDAASAIFERNATIVREAGALAELPIYISSVGLDRAWRGDLAGARLLVAESETVAAATGSRLPPFAALRLHALEGDEHEGVALIDATIEQGEASGQGLAVRVAQWAASVLYNGLARYEDAFSAAQQAADNATYIGMWALPELVEAAVRVGRIEPAQDAIHRLAERTRAAGTDWALGTEARSRALLGDADEAAGLYEEAIERLGRTSLRPELARAHLLYGEWLRREGRRVASREQLRTAHDMFGEMGMQAFAGRARRELAGTGEHARRRDPHAREGLTAQEEQIARLARDGLSNREIAGTLYLSSRTVEWHLRKVFMKLDIGSRGELRTALPERLIPCGS